MAAPTGGHPYGGGRHVPGEQGDNRFDSRFDTPSVPGGQGPGDPYQQQPQHRGGWPRQSRHAQDDDWPQQPGPAWPGRQQDQPRHQQPPQRYDRPSARVQPVQRHTPEPSMPASLNPLVRPYAMTGGRTRPRYQLAIEALVSTTADPAQLQGQLPEHQRICRLCVEIKSVAEVSALLSIPLGVVRILVADLAEAGLVAIHQPGGEEAAGGQPDVTLLERVLSGLRKL
ncbi:DUF742 domain-containing protein [Streptomyces sp. NBC_01754]|uniref:DUF742 domain-containing protein n=1 Tax=Streptomyces sp. NBC_01754 TaxID=2975930 RepID=UPI002DD8790F|nr:DUF742 domain-containing protein [Streptomyces sp. NBC_01754]WSC95060.1 DUF742 domain-containing protein [Streptomyces sp. NBC_01754]